MFVIDGNDPRQIDVGVLSKYPIVGAATHQFEPFGSALKDRTFSRDCLVVEVAVGTERLTVLVNHFKSKIGGGEEKRERQARRVAEILTERFGPKLAGKFVVCGDLNAHYDAPELQPLLGLKGLHSVVRERLPAEEHWTHKGKLREALDHVLLSPRLATKNPKAVPWIDRKGLAPDVDVYTGPRYDATPKSQGASDHCPVFIRVEV